MGKIDKFQYSKAFIGQPAPDFKTQAVVGDEFAEVKLSDYKGKYLVIFFYPLDLCVFLRLFLKQDFLNYYEFNCYFLKFYKSNY